ncbi:SDR family NAD(P)-dependent oxidoreductase [Reichenbachiella agarivorans]|uniref:SDR family NAD(P)-dependent oxidoreductase n=1 Tax=Reichenbachiella agarivorans TaxID=2979464 RepID=A0ABY6CST5_9BACT|nr:SDR family NAD(P)-dependent oxidoreductase [Reichenbachiella agarivorans]UXP33055.1 SDR family NAD(P)-dependent oxidoreductase [Reichenbachiella agarivorans]
MNTKTVLILGANSDVAKEAIVQYLQHGCHVIAASRSIDALHRFVQDRSLDASKVEVLYFDAVDFASHAGFYQGIKTKPSIVLYAAGYLVDNQEALLDWDRTYQMMNVHYCGAVSILNLIVSDQENVGLERIVGLSSLSGVRGRKSNFVYGSSKSAFTQYLAGLRQHLYDRNITVNVIVAGYIRSKMTAGLDLTESLMLEPSYIARAVVHVGNQFVSVPGLKWKLIYHVLRWMPEQLVAKLP